MGTQSAAFASSILITSSQSSSTFSVSSSVCLFFCLSFYLSICLSGRAPICLFISRSYRVAHVQVLGVNFFHKSDPENFATFSISFFTMFQVSTGAYWGTIARSHLDENGYLKVGSLLFFASAVLIVTLSLLQVVIAVLLDNFTLATRREKDKMLMDEAEKRQVRTYEGTHACTPSKLLMDSADERRYTHARLSVHVRTYAPTHFRLACMHALKLLHDDAVEQQATEEGEGQIIKFGLDPLIQTLVNYTNQDEITSKLAAIFKRLDSGIRGCCC